MSARAVRPGGAIRLGEWEGEGTEEILDSENTSNTNENTRATKLTPASSLTASTPAGYLSHPTRSCTA